MQAGSFTHFKLFWIALGATMFGVAHAGQLKVDPRGTYLRVSQDPGAHDPVPIDLRAMGLEPGDDLSLQAVGDFAFIPGGPEDGSAVTGMFSSDQTVLGGSNLNRIPGAIDAGQDVITGPTDINNLPTDVPQDFSCDGSSLTIPIGANYLFLSPLDSYYGDNEDRDNDLYIILRSKRHHVAGLFALSGNQLFRIDTNSMQASLIGTIQGADAFHGNLTYDPGVGLVGIGYDNSVAGQTYLTVIDLLDYVAGSQIDLGNGLTSGYFEGIEHVPGYGLIVGKSNGGNPYLTHDLMRIGLDGAASYQCTTSLDNDSLCFDSDLSRLISCDPNDAHSAAVVDLLSGSAPLLSSVPGDCGDYAYDPLNHVAWSNSYLTGVNRLYKCEMGANSMSFTDLGQVSGLSQIDNVAYVPSVQVIAPDAERIMLGQAAGGDLNSWSGNDLDFRRIKKAFVPNFSSPFARVELDFHTENNLPGFVALTCFLKMDTAGSFVVSMSLKNQQTGTYTVVCFDTAAHLSLTAFAGLLSANVADYVGSGGLVTGRIEVRRIGFSAVAVPSVSFNSAHLSVLD